MPAPIWSRRAPTWSATPWPSAAAARRLLAEGRLAEWAAWLREVGLVPFTLNGFPFGDFHQTVVKHRVYEPTWQNPARFAYTRDLITILDRLLPAKTEGSISTLPIAWAQPSLDHLRQTAAALASIA